MRVVPIEMPVELIRAGVKEFVDGLSENRVGATVFCARSLAFRALSRGGPR